MLVVPLMSQLALAHHVRGLVLVRQLADDGLQQIVVGDQPLDDAKLVRHQNEAAPGLAQLRQQPDHVDGLGHDDGLVLLASSPGLPLVEGKQQIPRLDHPDDLVQLPVTDREQAVGGPLQQGADLVRSR
jgi:hypothetical protein